MSKLRLEDLTDEDFAAFQRVMEVCHAEMQATGYHQPTREAQQLQYAVANALKEVTDEDARSTLLEWSEREVEESIAPLVPRLGGIAAEAMEAVEFYRKHPSLPITEDYREVGGQLIPYNDDWLSREGAVPKPEGVPSELADVVIRTLGDAYVWNIDLVSALRRKLRANRDRPRRSGGRAF